MTAKPFKGKAIYNPSGKAGEYSQWACNLYTGCSNDCIYCYCKRGAISSVWSIAPKLKRCFRDEKHAVEVFEKELKKNITELREHGLFFSFITDPLLPACKDLTWEAVMMAMENDVPVKILTKVAGIWVDQLIENMHPSWKNLIAIGFTLTGHDELEPNASSNQERIDAMKRLHAAGFITWASIEPIVDIQSSSDMIFRTLGFCDLYKIGLMSGKKYDKDTLQDFIVQICYHVGDKAKIYFKDSLLEQSHVERKELTKTCVDRDYNLFKSA